MPLKDMATSTGAFVLIRMLGGTIGISIGDAIYSSELIKRLRKIPDIGSFLNGRSIDQLKDDVQGLTRIQVCCLESSYH